jgi:hypothetical protein
MARSSNGHGTIGRSWGPRRPLEAWIARAVGTTIGYRTRHDEVIVWLLDSEVRPKRSGDDARPEAGGREDAFATDLTC